MLLAVVPRFIPVSTIGCVYSSRLRGLTPSPERPTSGSTFYQPVGRRTCWHRRRAGGCVDDSKRRPSQWTGSPSALAGPERGAATLFRRRPEEKTTRPTEVKPPER
ncbi:unnamed protein product, partial [Protopolystoma xenopodis]